MGHTFVQVGRHWINVDLVTSIEIVQDPNDPAKLIAARVHYTTGKDQDFKVPAEVQDLADWFRAHRAP